MSELKEITKSSSLVVAFDSKKPKTKERLADVIGNYQTKQERNEKILKAYKVGYSQQMIAEAIGISQQAVGKIIKSEKL